MGYKTTSDGNRIVALRALLLGNTSFKRTDDGTEQMNVNGQASGAQLVVWNGTGAQDTGGDWSVSGLGSETAESAHSGTNGWDSGLVGANSATEFNNGALLDVAGTYTTLRFWLQPKAYPGNATLQLQWKNNVGTVIGATLNVENYVTNMDLDVWQHVSVPVADFNLTGDVQRLVVKYQKGNQQHWIDDIELLAAGGGGPFVYRVAPESASQHFHMTMMVLILSAPQTGWAAQSFANVAGGLEEGVLVRQRRLSTGEVLWSLNSKDNTDLFGRFHPQDDVTFSDGTLLVGFMLKPGDAAVVVSSDEVVEVVIRDDLSSLTSMRAYMHYGVEEVA